MTDTCVVRPLALAELLARRGHASPLILLHAAKSWHDAIAAGQFDFFTKLGTRAGAEGFATRLVRAEGRLSRWLRARPHLHLFIGDPTGSGPQVLHAMPSYVWGFWYLDPRGAYARSSLASLPFAPEAVDPGKARWFFDGVAGYMLRENVSKFPQASRNDALAPAAATVFLQEIETYRNPVHFIGTLDMVSATARAFAGARVYVKLHPAQSGHIRTRVEQFVAETPGLVISAASIHDLAAASGVIVTQNSAAGFEALLQRKPVVTCARCDYHHATVTARTTGSLVQAVTDAPRQMAGFAYDRFLYWFLARHCLEPQAPEFGDRVWQRLQPMLAALG